MAATAVLFNNCGGDLSANDAYVAQLEQDTNSNKQKLAYPVETEEETMDFSGPGENDRSEEDRITAQKKNKELNKQLEDLKAELASVKDSNKMTDLDALHQENVKQGRDKYKTLKQIRCGNTKQRIDEFEAL